MLGGNSLTVGIFNLQYGDPVGSALTMRALKRCQNINNFPVQNDNRVLGLLRKYRVEIQQLQQLAGNTELYPGSNDHSNVRVAELERKLLDTNIVNMKTKDESNRLISQMGEIKNKFNDVVKSKTELQQELITSEEEKLKVSKALIELQIENTQLNESLQNQTFDVETKLMHA